MISRSAATVLFGASTAIAGLYVLIRVVKNEKKVTRKRTGSTDHNANGETGIISASKMLSSSSTMNGNGGDDYKNRSKARITKTSKTAAPCEDLDDAPMFNYSDPKLCEAVIAMAQNRAKRWISYQVTGASRLVGQVGGKSAHKRPVLTLEPDFILKPVHMDERGIREVAFYEAIQASTKRSLFDTYCRIFGPKDLHNPTKYASSTLLNISKWLGISVQEQHSDSCCDPETISMEIKLLHRLALFTAEYFGLVDVDHKNDSNCQTSTSGFDRKCQSCCYGTTYTSYILAHNLTINFSKPSVLDIKMGVETFEPDAPEDKKIREINKYELQHEMGFRIVAIRIYDPTNVQASNDGYIYFPKSFGRSLTSREQVKHAMITFFGGEENEKLQSREVLENRSHSIKKILSKLKLIRKWFQENDIFSFTASSLLMMYESNDNASQPGGADVKMIDFGRVRRRKGGDPGYHQGLRMLMSILEEILRDEFRSEDYDYVP